MEFFRDKTLSPYSVRLSVRTSGFQPEKRGSTPLPSTRFNCIGLPMPVGNIASWCSLPSEPCLCYRKLWDLTIVISGRRWISWHVMWLMTNRMTNTWLAVEQLLSNIPVQLNVVLVVSFWKNAVSTCIMHFHWWLCVHAPITSCAKGNWGQHLQMSSYKVWAVKANDNRVIVVHNETIQLISWSNWCYGVCIGGL